MNFLNAIGVNPQGVGVYILIGILVIILLWLVFREARTWYWKINEIVAILERIEERLAANKENLASLHPTGELPGEEKK